MGGQGLPVGGAELRASTCLAVKWAQVVMFQAKHCLTLCFLCASYSLAPVK